MKITGVTFLRCASVAVSHGDLVSWLVSKVALVRCVFCLLWPFLSVATFLSVGAPGAGTGRCDLMRCDAICCCVRFDLCMFRLMFVSYVLGIVRIIARAFGVGDLRDARLEREESSASGCCTGGCSHLRLFESVIVLVGFALLSLALV